MTEDVPAGSCVKKSRRLGRQARRSKGSRRGSATSRSSSKRPQSAGGGQPVVLTLTAISHDQGKIDLKRVQPDDRRGDHQGWRR
jgi:hypothetical protein